MKSWLEIAELYLGDAFKAIAADMAGKPYKSPLPSLPVYEGIPYRCVKDFVYKHIDQDINRGTYTFKAGQVYKLRDEMFIAGIIASHSDCILKE